MRDAACAHWPSAVATPAAPGQMIGAPGHSRSEVPDRTDRAATGWPAVTGTQCRHGACASPRRCDDVQVGDAVIGSLAIIGPTTPGEGFPTTQVTAHRQAPGRSNACGESVS